MTNTWLPRHTLLRELTEKNISLTESSEYILSRAEAVKNEFRSHSSRFDFDKIPQWYVEKMDELGEKYRGIRWLPLDIPKFKFDDHDKFMKVWDEEAIDILRLKPDSAEHWNKDTHPLGENSHWYKPAFKGLDIYDIGHKNAGVWTWKYSDNPIFRPLVEHVQKYFPFHIIYNMYIWESCKQIEPHTDQTFFWNCPTEFRIMLNDENEKPTLYVADMDDYQCSYIDLPEDTNALCWSNGSQMHGSDYHGKRKQLLIIDGIYSMSKYEDLINRSIEKYKDRLNYELSNTTKKIIP
jgi:hypothetical protein